MYIKYTFDGAILLVRQVLRTVALPVTLVLAIEALSVRFRTRLELLLSRGNVLAAAFLEGLPCTLTFLEGGGLVDHQHMIILFDVHLRYFHLSKELSDHISGTNLIVINYKTFVARSVNLELLWNLAVQLLKALSVAHHLNGVLTNGTPFLHLVVKEFLRDLISLRTGLSLKHVFQLLENLKGPGKLLKTILKIRFHSIQHGDLNQIIIILARLINSFFISRRIYSRGVT